MQFFCLSLQQIVRDPSSKLLTRTTTLWRQGQWTEAVKDVAFVVYMTNKNPSSGLYTIVIRCTTADSCSLSVERYVV